MRTINQKAKKVFDALTAGMEQIGDHKKIENDPYMPLSIEVIDTYGPDEGIQISLCHYGKQNGDLMRDPEMIFIKALDGQYYPYYYRNDYVGIEQYSVEFAPDGMGIERYWKSLQRQQATFAGQWAQNLKEQGFIEALNKPTKEFKGDIRDFIGRDTTKQLEGAGLIKIEDNRLIAILPEVV